MSVDNDILAISLDIDKIKLEFNYLLEQGNIDKAMDKTYELFNMYTDLQSLLLDKQNEGIENTWPKNISFPDGEPKITDFNRGKEE